MHIKRFEASSLLEAVRLVKEELGPDAVVLSSRRVRRADGWLGRFGRSRVEITAAVDRDPRAAPAAPGRARVSPDPSWRELRITKALVDPLEAELRELRRVVEGLSRPAPELAELSRGLRELRRTMEAPDREGSRRKRPVPSERMARRLRSAGLAEEHAAAVSKEAAARLAAQPGPTGDVPEARALGEALAARLDPHLEPPRPDLAAGVELLVGAPGVGKTTSLAKLAAREEQQDGRCVLLTTDVGRVGAEEQLRGLADHLHVPFDVAATPQELAQRVARLGRRRVWVDTAGLAAQDGAALCDLARARALLGRRARVHLVVSATTKSNDLLAELDRFRLLRPDSLIVTRVDASRDLGNVATLLFEPDAPPLSWMGNGQRIPEDLWLPGPEELATRILAGAT